MNDDWKRFPTDYAVWCAIKKAHPNLAVFSSATSMDGQPFGTPGEGYAYTSYGFRDGDFPIICAESRWVIDKEQPSGRSEETHKYWLCVGIKEEP